MELHGHAESAVHHVVVAVLGAQRLVGHLQARGVVHRAVDPRDLGRHTDTRTHGHAHTHTIEQTQANRSRDRWLKGNNKDVFSVQIIG